MSSRAVGLCVIVRRGLLGRALAASALIVVSVASLGCTIPVSNGALGSAGTGGTLAGAPVIDDISMPDYADPGSDGYYTIDGWISFHDDDNVVHTVRMFVPRVGKTYEFPAGDVPSGNATPLLLRFVADVPLLGVGVTEYDLSLVDAKGAVSAKVARTVDLR